MEPISRRSVLTLGGLGLLSTAVGGTGLWRELSSSTLEPATGATFTEPETVRSRGGRLEVRLVADAGRRRVAGRDAVALGYNGGLPGPTLRVRPGDTLRVDLVNRLDRPTNLHVHGLHVSPEGNGDNVFLTVPPGGSQRYEYRLPPDHPPGVYWYHPHHHGTVADQVFGGLYGAILVEDDGDVRPDRERVMVVSDLTLDRRGRLVTPSTMEQMAGREGELLLLNGQAAPVLAGRAGERERWRLVNACTSRYLSLTLPGQPAQVLGRDVGRVAGSPGLGEVVLAPGNRLDLLVDLAEAATELVAHPVDRGGMMGGMMPGGPVGDDRPRTLARLQVAAGGGAPSAPVRPAPPPRDLRGEQVAARRRLLFGMGMSGGMMGGGSPMTFTIDGREFDPGRVDQEVRLGTVEEWTIGNDSPLDHPFHLHVWPMQVVDVAGRRPAEPLWLDVVNVPARSELTVRVAFEDFGGRTVYHCHILDHEDRGMMGTVEAREDRKESTA